MSKPSSRIGASILIPLPPVFSLSGEPPQQETIDLLDIEQVRSGIRDKTVTLELKDRTLSLSVGEGRGYWWKRNIETARNSN